MAKSLSIAPGTRVQVLSADGNTNLGIGTYRGEEEIEDSGGLTTPKIELASGQIIYGFECWWYPT
jgi:hypothetical protein